MRARTNPVCLSNGISLNLVLSATRDGFMIGNQSKYLRHSFFGSMNNDTNNENEEPDCQLQRDTKVQINMYIILTIRFCFLCFQIS